MKTLFTSLTILLAIVQCRVFAQDPQFSQFYANPVYLNPAMVGTAQQYRVSFNHRRQGEPTTGYITSAFSIDSDLFGGNTGWGLQFIKDNQFSGLVNVMTYSGAVSQKINITNNSRLGLGIRVGGYNKSFNSSGLTFEDQLDGRNGVVNNTQEEFDQYQTNNFNVDAGLLYSSDKLFAGVNISHINQPKEFGNESAENQLLVRYTFHAGGILRYTHYRRQDYVISPNIIYERQGTFNYLNLGMYYATETWSVGSWYRWNDAVIVSLGLNVKSFKIGYSYDISVREYDSMNGNSHEFSVAYHFEIPKKFKVKNKYKGQCPAFQKYLF